MTLRTDVAALFVDPLGPYPKLLAEWWDEKRDATRYTGPLPVVAHPPCGPWSKLRHLCTKQDPACGPFAVAAVREFGGVLEHPEHSLLFRWARMPLPGELPDQWGGLTYRVEQVAWGHPCVKPTWLYVVGVRPEIVRVGIRTGGTATHCVCTGPGFARIKVASKPMKRRTPVAFAEWLIELAAQSRRLTEVA
ncbi:MAG TPA: hypothetical protein VK841_09520 [Polyangiaceae bacterium]|nr:hypothetical protein [Polyangiaceae bacterium]